MNVLTEQTPMEAQIAHPEELIKHYLIPADTQKIRCVDERFVQNPTNGIQIQGASSGIVDALKEVLKGVTGYSEDSAWRRLAQQGVPVDGHDDDHKGPNGCGYNNRVETDPQSVGAPEAVFATSRLSRVPEDRVLHYKGEHAPAFATINFIADKTLDTNGILAEGHGTFNLDAWALMPLATKLGLDHDQSARFVLHVVDSYKKTITTLTAGAISSFVELH